MNKYKDAFKPKPLQFKIVLKRIPTKSPHSLKLCFLFVFGVERRGTHTHTIASTNLLCLMAFPAPLPSIHSFITLKTCDLRNSMEHFRLTVRHPIVEKRHPKTGLLRILLQHVLCFRLTQEVEKTLCTGYLLPMF